MEMTSTAVAGAAARTRRVASTPEAPGRLMSIKHHVGRGPRQVRQGLLGGTSGPGDLDTGHRREQPGQAVAEDRMVIDDEDPGHAGTASAVRAAGS